MQAELQSGEHVAFRQWPFTLKFPKVTFPNFSSKPFLGAKRRQFYNSQILESNMNLIKMHAGVSEAEGRGRLQS